MDLHSQPPTPKTESLPSSPLYEMFDINSQTKRLFVLANDRLGIAEALSSTDLGHKFTSDEAAIQSIMSDLISMSEGQRGRVVEAYIGEDEWDTFFRTIEYEMRENAYFPMTIKIAIMAFGGNVVRQLTRIQNYIKKRNIAINYPPLFGDIITIVIPHRPKQSEVEYDQLASEYLSYAAPDIGMMNKMRYIPPNKYAPGFIVIFLNYGQDTTRDANGDISLFDLRRVYTPRRDIIMWLAH